MPALQYLVCPNIETEKTKKENVKKHLIKLFILNK